MSFHYYSCRYLPPLPSTHVCLSRGLQWRLDKNSPKINHSISQPSENNCLYFHQISTLDCLGAEVSGPFKTSNPWATCPQPLKIKAPICWTAEKRDLGAAFVLLQWGRSDPKKILQAIWSIRMVRPIAIRTTINVLQIFQIIWMNLALMFHVIIFFWNVCFQKKLQMISNKIWWQEMECQMMTYTGHQGAVI